jgi:hypothetical protein
VRRANVAVRWANVAVRRANVGPLLRPAALLAAALLPAALLAAALLAPRAAGAHAFDPETLLLRERSDGRYALTARAAASLGPDAAAPTAILPDGCALAATDAGTIVDCGAAGLRGRSLGARAADPRREVLARVLFLDGTEAARVLHDAADRLALPAAAARPAASEVARGYLALGVRHILLGLDHLAFLLGLLGLVRGARALVRAVTAFTLAHSVTLALGALGAVSLPQAPVEALIALSIVAVARELARVSVVGGSAPEPPSRPDPADGLGIATAPAVAAFAFGLLHGLGFAGALHEAGLPDGHVPLALVAFNAGVELGQLAVVAACLALVAAARRLPLLPLLADTRRLARAASVALGGLGVAWLLERVVAFWSPTA